MDNGIIPWLENAGQAGERTMNPISEFIQANPLGAGGIAVGILAVLFFLKRFSRSDTVDMSDPGRAGRGDAKAQKKARGGWFSKRKNFIDCVGRNDIEEMEAQLAEGVDINMKDGLGETALMNSVMEDKLEVMKFLLDNGADTEIRDISDNTVLKNVALSGSVEMARKLIEKGASLNPDDDSGSTLLIYALGNRHFPEMIEFLIDKGINLNVRPHEFAHTPLMVAAALGYEKSVETLLKLGADPSMKDEDGKTALDFAREREPINEIIVGMLEEVMAK